MKPVLSEKRFDYVSKADKEFVDAFNREMNALGYTFGDEIGSGYCWGRHMLIYRNPSLKSQKVFARIYLRDKSTVLRMFFSNVDKHSAYIETALAFINEAFTGSFGKCGYCAGREDKCMFRKSYTIGGKPYEKCSGCTFEFAKPSVKRLDGYIGLFTTFYPNRRAGKRAGKPRSAK